MPSLLNSTSSVSRKALGLAPATAAMLGVLAAAGQAQAAQIYATDVVYYDNNDTVMAEYRSELDNALGDPGLTTDSANGYDGNQDFLSLGMGGRAVFDFGQEFSGEVTVWETTWGYKSSQSAFDERIDIYYGNFGSDADWESLAYDLDQWTAAGEILNVQDNAYNTAAGAANSGSGSDDVFSHILLVDKSVTVGDGFDVNAIAVDVPEPSSVLGLLGLAAVGAKRLRRREAV